MTTLALYVGRSDANGVRLPARTIRPLLRAVEDALYEVDATILARGTLAGRDEDGTPETSEHWLIDVPPTSSLLVLFGTIAQAVRWSGQRSYGVVGWSSSTVVPVNPSTALRAWYLTAPPGAIGRGSTRA